MSQKLTKHVEILIFAFAIGEMGRYRESVSVLGVHDQKISRQRTMIKIHKRYDKIRGYNYHLKDIGAKVPEGFHYSQEVFSSFLLQFWSSGME